MSESVASGREAVELATALLQRARLAHPTAGVWEAADVQWWWRRPRSSDSLEQVFWSDEDGPVAAAYVTSWGEDTWQCDPMVVPGSPAPPLEVVWARALQNVAARASSGTVEVLVRDDDTALRDLAEGSGFVAGDAGGTLWMDVGSRPEVRPLAAGFTLADRSQRPDAPHPMRERNGDGVAERLGQTSLYDPGLDLAVEAADGRPAAYSLYWYDPVTRVGMVEPVRVEDEFQRRGLATAMITAGIDRLAARGAERIKIGFSSPVAAGLYQGLGFQPTTTDATYVRRW